MFLKKKQIQRVVVGACKVQGGGPVSQPVTVTIKVVKPSISCWLWRPRSHRVTKYYFEEKRIIPHLRMYTSFTATMDLETLFRCATKYPHSCEVMISTRCHLGKRHGVHIALDTFLEQLMRLGPPDEFLVQVCHGKVAVMPFLHRTSASRAEEKNGKAQRACGSEECGEARLQEGVSVGEPRNEEWECSEEESGEETEDTEESLTTEEESGEESEVEATCGGTESGWDTDEDLVNDDGSEEETGYGGGEKAKKRGEEGRGGERLVKAAWPYIRGALRVVAGVVLVLVTVEPFLPEVEE
ncbi:hypothetical protein E2C01_091088 [Portunus trituberculatus]|uniref:Uncharacterized protein n=1 Tax=Portunus trituberculatus TaxID=210409 RepID=A0A5B7JM28_PORTR|nr:hypothetical protein [Portunus trituberculatus]